MELTGLRQIPSSPSNSILIAFYVLEFSALLTTLDVYKKAERPIPVFLADSAAVLAALLVIGTAQQISMGRKPSVRSKNPSYSDIQAAKWI
jgi:hypothetical protein